MSTDTDSPELVAGEYVVVLERVGHGADHYYSVAGPDGRSTEQTVYTTYSMTPFQAAEQAVAGHLGHEDWHVGAATRSREEGGYVVTVGS